MADSNITKRALATSLKELMVEQPFDKINVAQICEHCNMNRKSFYYHFKDKYDLVNWFFDTEFIELIKHENLSADYTEHWAFIEKTAGIFTRIIRSIEKHCRSKGKILSAITFRSIFGRL
ncbi:TetR family transcriptional regulator [Intestinimonas timonensis]|uniref:TetR family transcriptional regulator n=1 Tax=Intestinimonas timonensis TaxID=1689270 RepID=UPI001F5ED80C|nr:TetR family transcriptional regulator [Intestinimonas timonensis]